MLVQLSVDIRVPVRGDCDPQASEDIPARVDSHVPGPILRDLEGVTDKVRSELRVNKPLPPACLALDPYRLLFFGDHGLKVAQDFLVYMPSSCSLSRVESEDIHILVALLVPFLQVDQPLDGLYRRSGDHGLGTLGKTTNHQLLVDHILNFLVNDQEVNSSGLCLPTSCVGAHSGDEPDLSTAAKDYLLGDIGVGNDLSATFDLPARHNVLQVLPDPLLERGVGGRDNPDLRSRWCLLVWVVLHGPPPHLLCGGS